MEERSLITMAKAMTNAEESCEAKLRMESEPFSKMDVKGQQEEKFIEAYLTKQKDKKDAIKALKTKLGLKKVEAIFGDIAVVSDSHYRMGVISIEGKVIVPFGKYGWIGSFREVGTAPVRDGKRFSSNKKKEVRWGRINKFGEEVEPLE